MVNWRRRGLKYYPDNICELYELENQACHFCGKHKIKLMMEHNHTTGSFRGFTCSGCNINLGITDRRFRSVMKELLLISNLPKVFIRKIKI